LHLTDAVVKNVPNPLPTSPRLYAQVDLFDNTTPGMGVVNEGAAGETNNIADSNGQACRATPGFPDLIVESIRMVSAAGAGTTAAVTSTGAEPVPPRAAMPQK
jgi:hypothetical protein